MNLQQGDCIRLPGPAMPHDPPAAPAADPLRDDHRAADQLSEEHLYQVVSVDAPGDRCWLRRWPLARHGSPVFELSLRQLQTRQPHRPPLQGPG